MYMYLCWISIARKSFFIVDYENERMVGRNYIDCPDGKRSNSDPNKVCRFDITVLGSDCDHVHNYGFDEGRPCILLKLNRVKSHS